MFWQQVFGFGLALMSMVLYGIYMVPRKQSNISQKAYTFWMGSGILVGTMIIGLIADLGIPRVTLHQYAMIVISGVVWGTGTLAYCSAVKFVGLSRSTPIKNTSAVLGTLIGVLIFHELSFHRVLPATLAISGSIAVVVAATILARVESFEDAHTEAGSRHVLYGVLTAAWAAIAYSAYTIPMKLTYAHGVTPSAFLFFMGQGIFVGMSALSLLLRSPKGAAKVTRRDALLAQTSGLMWAIGSLFANVAVKYIGVAVTWPLTKNTVVAVLYGVLVLKEVDRVKHRRDLRIGLALSVLGILLLAAAMK